MAIPGTGHRARVEENVAAAAVDLGADERAQLDRVKANKSLLPVYGGAIVAQMPPPLQGVRVLDLSRALAGPFCSMILADLGADVAKVEPTPDGEMVRKWGPFKDGVSVYYLSIHRNKRSVAVNFRDARGLELIRQMADQADILIENFKPGVTREMKMDYATLSRRNPRLIFASITGFGTTGPYGNWPGVDQIAQGMSGLMSLTGQKETGPTRVGIPIADVVAGMWAALGCQAAIIQRQTSGKGQLVETSLLGGLIALLNVQAQRHLTLGETPDVAGNDHPVICPYGMFHAKDGPFNLAVATQGMWPKLCGLIGMPELAGHPDFKDNSARVRNRDALKRILNGKFAARGKMEWTLELVKLGLPAGPILSLDQVFSDPHINQTQMVEHIEHPRLGSIRLLANPVRFAGKAGASIRTPPPSLGQHTREVLRDYGIPADRSEALFAEKVLMDAR